MKKLYSNVKSRLFLYPGTTSESLKIKFKATQQQRERRAGEVTLYPDPCL